MITPTIVAACGCSVNNSLAVYSILFLEFEEQEETAGQTACDHRAVIGFPFTRGFFSILKYKLYKISDTEQYQAPTKAT